MADRHFPSARYWLRQSRQDLSAAKTTKDAKFDSTSRYLAQQAYEKAIKAYCLWRIQGHFPDDVELILRDTFFRAHSPLTDFRDPRVLEDLEERLTRRHPRNWEQGMKALKLVIREARAAVHQQTNSSALEQIDDTRPSINAAYVSYRYPFFTDNGEATAPADWTGWDRYQGEWTTVTSAIEALQTYAASTAKAGRGT